MVNKSINAISYLINNERIRVGRSISKDFSYIRHWGGSSCKYWQRFSSQLVKSCDICKVASEAGRGESAFVADGIWNLWRLDASVSFVFRKVDFPYHWFPLFPMICLKWPEHVLRLSDLTKIPSVLMTVPPRTWIRWAWLNPRPKKAVKRVVGIFGNIRKTLWWQMLCWSCHLTFVTATGSSSVHTYTQVDRKQSQLLPSDDWY